MANNPNADANNLSAYYHGETFQFEGKKPQGLKIAIIGAGHIGGLVAEAMKANGHTVVATSSRIVDERLKAVKDADALYTDIWVSMGKEEESKKRFEDLKDNK